jgi:hypothetical protein
MTGRIERVFVYAKKVIYISGPITGMPGNNREAFFSMEYELCTRYKDAQIINPVRIGIQLDCEKLKFCRAPTWDEYMRAGIKALCKATHITFLPGYENSKGAMLEKEIAEKLGIKELVL